MAAMDRKKWAAGSLRVELDRTRLPGFDLFMHMSPVVDESVEEQDGQLVVVYRTKPEITEEAQRRPLMTFSR